MESICSDALVAGCGTPTKEPIKIFRIYPKKVLTKNSFSPKVPLFLFADLASHVKFILGVNVSARFEFRLPISKVNAEAGTVTGWAAISTHAGTPLIDYHDEYIPVSELLNSAHNLVLDGGKGKAGEMHDERVGDIVESMVFDSEKTKALGLGDGTLEGWAVTLKIRDTKSLERVKSGELKELSIHGLAEKTVIGKRNETEIKALSNMIIDEVSLVDEGASGNKEVAPRIVIAKRNPSRGAWVERMEKIFSKGEKMEMTLESVLSKLSEEERNFILGKMEELKAVPAPAPEAVVVEDAKAPSEDDMKAAVEKLPPKVQEEVKKRLESAKELETLREEVTKMRDQKELEGFIEKAKALKFLSGKVEEVAKTLHAVSKSLSKDEFAKIEKLFADANAAIGNGDTFKVIGKTGDGETSSESYKTQIEQMAKARAKEKGVTEYEAYKAVARENPELYTKYREEIRG